MLDYFTGPLGEGKDESFASFAWRCATGIDYLYNEVCPDNTIPLVTQPSDFYPRRIAEYKETIAKYKTMSAALLKKEVDNLHQNAVELYERMERERVVERERFMRMRTQVADWQPPTPRHERLKLFMIQKLDATLSRIDEGLRRVCEPPQKPDVEAYRAQRIEETQWNLRSAEKNHAAEVERVKQRNQWVAELAASIGDPKLF